MVELNTDYDPHLLQRAMGAMSVKRTALENAILEEKIGTMPEERNWLKRCREMQQRQGEQNLNIGAQNLETGKFNLENLRAINPMQRESAYMDFLHKTLPNMSLETYMSGGRDHLLKAAAGLGIDAKYNSLLPSPAQIISESQSSEKSPRDIFDEGKLSFKEKMDKQKAETERMTAEAHLLTALKEKDPKKSVIKSIDLGDKVEIYADDELLKTVEKGKDPNKSPSIRTVDRGNEVDVYIDGKKETFKKGAVPTTEKPVKTNKIILSKGGTQKSVDKNADEFDQLIEDGWVPYTKPKDKSSVLSDLGLEGSTPKFTKTATNPTTGEKVGWDGTKWVPMK